MAEAHILMFQDLHAADRSPPFRKDNYVEAIESKLTQVAAIATKLDARAIINAGDTFHKKKPTENSHHLVQKVVEWLKHMPCPVYGVTGNHDLTRDDRKSVDKQPIGTLYKSGAMKHLETEGTIHPLVDDNDMQVGVVGLDFRRNIEDVRQWLAGWQGIPKYNGDKRVWLVCVMHQYACAGGPGKVFDEPAIGYDELDQCRPDVYILGHDHRALGCGETPGGKVLLRPGALTRGSIAQEDVNRKPAIGWLTLTPSKASAKAVVLKYRDTQEAFDFSLKEEQDAKQATHNLFVEALTKVTTEKGVDIFTWLRAKEQDAKVTAKVLEFLEAEGVKEGE